MDAAAARPASNYVDYSDICWHSGESWQAGWGFAPTLGLHLIQQNFADIGTIANPVSGFYLGIPATVI
jgi:hypothetical protein